MSKLKREHFIRVNQDQYHYYYSFGVPGFEICLEPCAAGFDVCIYANSYPTEFPELKGEKICTKTGDYTTSIEGLFGDRSDGDWNKALAIADELLNKYVNGIPTAEEIARAKKERVWKECKHGVWLSPCPHCQKENQSALITGEEIKALRARAKKITTKDALRASLEGRFVLVIPMDLKSGYCVSYTIIENPPSSQLEVFSVGANGKPVDPADAELLAKAVLGEYHVLGNLLSKGMTHFMKKVKM